MGQVLYVPISLATTPANGRCLVDRYWTVHPERGLAFWFEPKGYYRSEEPAPQCNSSEVVCLTMTVRLYPGHECRFVPVVYLAHANREMWRLREQIATP